MAAFRAALLRSFPTAQDATASVVAGSVSVDARLIMRTSIDATAVATTLQTSPPTALSSLLGVTVEAVAVPSVASAVLAAPSPPPPSLPPSVPPVPPPPTAPPVVSDGLTLIIAISAGAGGALAIAIALFVWRWRTRRTSIAPTAADAPKAISKLTYDRRGLPPSPQVNGAPQMLQHRHTAPAPSGQSVRADTRQAVAATDAADVVRGHLDTAPALVDTAVPTGGPYSMGSHAAEDQTTPDADAALSSLLQMRKLAAVAAAAAPVTTATIASSPEAALIEAPPPEASERGQMEATSAPAAPPNACQQALSSLPPVPTPVLPPVVTPDEADAPSGLFGWLERLATPPAQEPPRQAVYLGQLSRGSEAGTDGASLEVDGAVGVSLAEDATVEDDTEKRGGSFDLFGWLDWRPWFLSSTASRLSRISVRKSAGRRSASRAFRTSYRPSRASRQTIAEDDDVEPAISSTVVAEAPVASPSQLARPLPIPLALAPAPSPSMSDGIATVPSALSRPRVEPVAPVALVAPVGPVGLVTPVAQRAPAEEERRSSLKEDQPGAWDEPLDVDDFLAMSDSERTHCSEHAEERNLLQAVRV